MMKQKNTFMDKVNKSIEEIDSTINQLLKKPPCIACPFNEFKDVHKLPHEGINPDRLKIDMCWKLKWFRWVQAR
jgi:hypothetical protein